MAQDSKLSLDDFERRYFDTTDSLETVLADAYFNPWKRELEVNEMVTVRIGQGRYLIRITQIDPFVRSEQSNDTGITDRLSYLETGTNPPPAGDPPTFSATIPDNTLSYNISVGNYTVKAGAGWAITYDTTVEPTVATPGQWPNTQQVPDYLVPATAYATTYTVRFWQYDDVDGWVNVLDYSSSSAGVSGTLISPKDTIVPTAGTVSSTSVGTGDATTERIITYTAGTYGGSGEDRVDLFAEEADGSNDAILVSDAATPETVTGLTPNKTYYVYARYTGVNGLFSESLVHTFTTDASGANLDTVIRIVKTTAYEETEGDNVVINFELGEYVDEIFTQIASDGNTTFKVKTVDDTAVDGTNFTGLPDTTTVTFSDTDTAATQTIATTDADENQNLTAELHIVPGSMANDGGDGQVPSIATYPDDAVIFKLLGTGGSDPAIERAAYVDEGVGGNDGNAFIWNASDLVTLTAREYSGTLNSFDLRTASPADVLNPAGGTMTQVCLGDLSGDRIQIFDLAQMASADYPIIVGSGEAGTYYLWVYSACDVTWENAFALALDGADVFIPNSTLHNVAFQSPYFWEWTKVAVTVTLSEGQHVFSIHKADNQAWLARFVLVDDNTFDPELSTAIGIADPNGDARGPLVSGTTTTGTVTDNPNNIQVPTIPTVSGTTATVTITSPIDGATRATHYQTLEAVITGASSINIATFVVTDSVTSAVIPGDVTLPGQGVIKWQPTQAMVQGNLHKVTLITGSAIVVGEQQSISWSDPTNTWHFTPLDLNSATNADITFVGNLDAVAANTVITPTVAQTLWGTGVASDGFVRGDASLVVDPLGNTAMGNVCKFHSLEGDSGGRGKFQVNAFLSSAEETLYGALDFLLPDDNTDSDGRYVMGWSGKMPLGFTAGANQVANIPTDGTTGARANCGHIGNPDITQYPAVPSPSPYPYVTQNGLALTHYHYDTIVGGAPRAFDDTYPPYIRPPAAGSETVEPTRGVWHRLEMKVYMGVNGGAAGTIDAWIDGRQVYENTAIFRTSGTFAWDRWFCEYMYGGGGSLFSCPKDQNMYWTNLVFSTTPITFEP